MTVGGLRKIQISNFEWFVAIIVKTATNKWPLAGKIQNDTFCSSLSIKTTTKLMTMMLVGYQTFKFQIFTFYSSYK